MRIEVEVYPGYWIEMDPHDLYDDCQMCLADCLAAGTIKLEELDGTCWWTFDFTQPRREIRVVIEDPA